MSGLKTLILAAGEGSRMKSKLPKVLHKIMGITMVEHVIGAANGAGSDEVAVVIGFKGDEVKEALKDRELKYYLQAKQLGTGHAVMCAEEFIDDNKDVLILYGDTPLLTSDTLKNLLDFHKKEDNGVTIISAIVDDPAGYGHIVRNENGAFVKNVEHKDATDEEKLVKEINTGVYVFKGASLKKALKKLNNNNAQGEYYLPDTLEILLKDGEGVNAMAVNDVSEFYGVNSRVQLEEASGIMKKRINRYHMENGVTICDSSSTYIAPSVKIGMDTVIYPGTVLEGNTVIGDDCKIGPYTKLTDVVVGDGTEIKFTSGTEATVGKNTTVGPYAYIRPNSKIGDNVKIGDFVEVKNSVIGNGTKVSHLTYIGDSDVGERINFGCGTVTVNYDGKKKFRTTIEDDSFIGCNTNLIAPVTVGKGSYIAAGSTITKDIPEDNLAVARARQQNIKGWKKSK